MTTGAGAGWRKAGVWVIRICCVFRLLISENDGKYEVDLRVELYFRPICCVYCIIFMRTKKHLHISGELNKAGGWTAR